MVRRLRTGHPGGLGLALPTVSEYLLLRSATSGERAQLRHRHRAPIVQRSLSHRDWCLGTKYRGAIGQRDLPLQAFTTGAGS